MNHFLSVLLAGLQEGGIIAIVVSALILLAGVVIMCVVLSKRRKQSGKEQPEREEKEPPVTEKAYTPVPEVALPPEEESEPEETSVSESEEEGSEEQVSVEEESAEEETVEAQTPAEQTPPDEAVSVPEEAEVPVKESEPIGKTAEEYAAEGVKVVFASVNRLVSVRYDKSFTARLIQTSPKNKEYYSAVKNELLRYSRVKSRISWRQESFRRGRNLMAKLELRGKTLCLYLALDPASYADSKYLVEDVSDKKKNADVPCMYRIRSDRRARYALELIAETFRGTDAKYKESEPIDYALQYPFEDTQTLVERELVKIVEERTGKNGYFEDDEEREEYEPEEELPRAVTAEEAGREMGDEEAEACVRQSDNISVRVKQTVVNVDTLGEYFEEGETVTLDDMRERIPFLNKKATYVKVLARGSLSKSLIVEADDFSLDAVKMIVLAGGTVYRKRAN